MVRFISCLLFLLLSYNITLAQSKFDGIWNVTISNKCEQTRHDLVVIIKDSNLITGEKELDISGAISDTGEVNIVVTHSGKTLYSVGHFTSHSGNGVWQSDNCSGYWKA